MKNQISMNIFCGKLGGRRPGSGRKQKYSPGVRHRKREEVTRQTPVHINFKYKVFVRTAKFKNILDKAIENAGAKDLMVRLYAVESNHVHIIAEPDSNEALTNGMKSLLRTIVKRLDKGSIQLERYHLHVLKTPKEAHNAVVYVLNNHVKHTGRHDEEFIEIVSKPKTWLLNQAL